MTKSATKKATIKANKSTSGAESGLEIRLQKFIADCGVTSRRKAEVMIREGRVTINGEVANEMGTKVNPYSDIVMVDGHLADLNAVEPIYLMLHKPRGVVTTLNDPEGRETVMDMVKEISERIYPVGRLDYLSEGLLLMTNDGEFANMIMHPKYNVSDQSQKQFSINLRLELTLKKVLLNQLQFVSLSSFQRKLGSNSV
jgi:16S rRNA U516 pseudouridylate synthase RsuA-like enzyme